VSVAELSVSLEPGAAEDVRAAVFNGLRAFNRQHAAPPNTQPLILSVRAGSDIVAGLVGDTHWEWLHVELLWVAEPYRRRGLGLRLLHAAEHEAVLRGARPAFLDTFDYQARPFYERQGYVVFGIQEDYPPGHTRYYLRKELTSEGPAI